MNDVLTCNGCFTDYLVKCVETITILGQLLPNTNYHWVIEDKFGNLYDEGFTTDEDGFWEIPIASLPAGLLTQYSGIFSLIVTKEGECGNQKMKIAQVYDCIQFTIKPGNLEKDYLGCGFNSNISQEGSLSELIVFTNQAQVTIPWTPTRATNFGNSPTIQVHHDIGGGIYQLVSVPVTRVTVSDVLMQLVIDNTVPMSGYVLLTT